MHTIYLCYLWLNELLVQAQVLPYLRQLLRKDGIKVSLMTFERKMSKNWVALNLRDLFNTATYNSVSVVHDFLAKNPEFIFE